MTVQRRSARRLRTPSSVLSYPFKLAMGAEPENVSPAAGERRGSDEGGAISLEPVVSGDAGGAHFLWLNGEDFVSFTSLSGALAAHLTTLT